MTAGIVVGFIGLGQMGSRMARNLLGRGARLVVFDADPTKMADFRCRQSDGDVVQLVGSAADVAAAAGVREIVTMLPCSQHVEAAFIGRLGLLEYAYLCCQSFFSKLKQL